MTDEYALLARIKGTPDDDFPRLVLADWLDEHGQPARAELIRLQVASKRLQAEVLVETGRQMELKSRAETLIHEFGEEWFGPYINFKPTFENGLIHIECKESDLK